MEIQIKFPDGMSQRDKNIILEGLRERFKGRQAESRAEAEMWVKAYIEEHLCLSVRDYRPPTRGKGFGR